MLKLNELGKKKNIKSLSSIGLVIILSSIFVSSVIMAKDEVNVYSARKEALIAPVLEAFSKENDVTVNLITGSADALLSSGLKGWLRTLLVLHSVET